MIAASREPARRALRCIRCIEGRHVRNPAAAATQRLGSSLVQRRRLHDGLTQPPTSQDSTTSQAPRSQVADARWDAFKQSLKFPSSTAPTELKLGAEVVVHGFLRKRRDKGAALSFCDLETAQGPRMQIVSNWSHEDSSAYEAHQAFKSIPHYSAVCVTGTLVEKGARTDQTSSPSGDGSATDGAPSFRSEASSAAALPGACDIVLKSIQCLSAFPKDIIVSKDVVFPPNKRHLQMRFSPSLRQRLLFRYRIADVLRGALRGAGFTEFETPVLFKSTPEGAREFLVPTRRKGFAYALPQSPQQYKQMLMAGGMHRYFQFARCFRDEDLRADRQPEFTQLDLEMAFATAEDVMAAVEHLLRSIFNEIRALKTGERGQDLGAYQAEPPHDAWADTGLPRYTYEQVMSYWGIDKPDLRIQGRIRRVEIPSGLKGMITHLENPIIEACKFRLNGSPARNLAFIKKFMDDLPKTTLKLSPGSTPGVFVFDPSKPLNGLSSFGHEAARELEDWDDEHWPQVEPGDVLIVHARPDEAFHGGSTDLGRLRKAIYDAAVEEGLLARDHELHPCWVNGFPMFSPRSAEDQDPGQGGSAGFASTHHPFTAPKTAADFDILLTDPLSSLADHYDLVINGVEVGGGSRRIHDADVQEFIMRDILKMTDDGVKRFAHLLDALRAGCPPHAGFALGFDRLVAILSDTESVRDVIAFPKNMKGEDMMVKSPTRMTQGQMRTYHLAMRQDDAPGSTDDSQD